MEESSSEIQSPLTENFPPVPSATLDSCPLILENDPSLEHLEKEETKNLGLETEILPIPSEISLPCALIEENYSPAVSVTLEFPPLISQNCEELEPLDNKEQQNPGPEISPFQVEEIPDKPVPGFAKFREILKQKYTVEDNSNPEDASNLEETEGNKLGLFLDSKNQLQYPRNDIMVAKPEGIGTQVDPSSGIRPIIFSQIFSPSEDIRDSLEPELPEILEESFGEKVTVESFTNTLIPVNVPALNPIVSDQLPTNISEVLTTEKTEAPDSTSSEIPQFGSPKICTQKDSPSLGKS
ncbi:uncharacterized protein PGTG_03003 [Puccinia graminis f. sp. tritici CRL 75-36-700-3]|uniref:Uncharacterized protein n=1 Tax=Puccinia graminis f. sp. tritici (strain CRL 75-36-700-3 / race SCCL) TaxID=418459 RepID=E3JYC2_PUCGT|nr:uncharacterized protein PGTG_03003 [Puccinia graminis f. sp. tritici CRL 75-36-700-3]EFP77047.1 hypothetical protein PGTG_03003 [Puccinia graminis f. sp. tritici CRL 75-36-700-3]